MNPIRYINSWQTVTFALVVCASIVAVFHVAGPEERLSLLTTFGILGTAIAASMRETWRRGTRRLS